MFNSVWPAAVLGTSYLFTFSPTATRGAGGIVAYSGVDTATPIDFEGANTSNGTASVTATAPAVTTTNLRSQVIVANAWQGGVTVTPDAATTDRFSAASSNSTASNNTTVEVA